MKINIRTLKLRLMLSYVLIVLLSFGFTAYFLDKALEENSLREIKSSLTKEALLSAGQFPPERLKIAGVARLELPLVQVQKQLAIVRKAVLAGLLFALGLALVVGSVLTAGIIRPVNRIIYGARRFSSGDFGHRILLDSKDEIGELALTLNKMARGLEEKITEVEVRNQHLGAILQSMVEGIIVVDGSSKILSMNPTAEKVFNISSADAQGRLFLEVIPNSDIADLITDALREEKFVTRELSLVWPVQKVFKIDVSPVFEKDEIAGCLVVIHDFTEIRRLETMRKDFVANVSHELKTPLTSIKGFIETLAEGALDDKENAHKFLAIIRDHADRLDGLVNDLLSLSYLESKGAALKIEEINFKDLVDRVLSGFQSQLKKAGIEARNDLAPGVTVRGDREKIGQVLTNLIDNAVKFNREKGIIRIYGQDAGQDIKIIVEDAGIGIPARDVPRIFERFYRVDKARSRELGGTGLGLSIVKHIVELHGGTVGVESVEGVGSRFFFTLPK